MRSRGQSRVGSHFAKDCANIGLAVHCAVENSPNIAQLTANEVCLKPVAVSCILVTCTQTNFVQHIGLSTVLH